MPKKKTKEEFIKEATEKHKGKYDYTNVKYVNSATKVCIICPEHGEFWKNPNSHLQGYGCSKCGSCYIPTTEEWIVSARKAHGDKYDYSKVKYAGSKSKVCIICPEHGEFWQEAKSHLSGRGCSKCGGNYIPTTEEWIASARKLHGDKYDYSKVKYVSSATKVCIICPEHGEFQQLPSQHLSGRGCPKCANEATGERCRSSKEEFIKKAREKHGDKYDYTKVEYVNSKTKVCIICHEHGEFKQTPHSHLQGQGCPKCSGKCVPTTEEWITSAHNVHGNKYDYSKVVYVDSKTKVCIICSEHGEFQQLPSQHLSGRGCPTCGVEKQTSTKEEFIKKAKEIHGDKYDYSKVDYSNAHTKVCIICPNHGEFWQTPSQHLQGDGCPKCGGTCVLTKEEWVAFANKVHNGKYDYSNVEYVNNVTKVCIICPEHGEYLQRPGDHTQGHGCPKCGRSYVPTTKEWITSAHNVHGNKYDYSKVDYVNGRTKVCIICHEHGEFWQTPSQHLQGDGCPKCNLSHLERSVMNYLDEVGITYDYQKRFKWLGKQSLDFYLPDYNVGVECQGIQHFEPVDYFGGEDGFKQTLERDKRKKTLCEKNGVKLLYFGNVHNYDTFLGEAVHYDVQYLIDYLK